MIICSNCKRLTRHQLPFVNRTTRDTELNPAPFDHWTLSEIWYDFIHRALCYSLNTRSEQPDSLFRALGCGSRVAGDMVVLGGLDKNSTRMLSINHLTIAAHGSSLNAANFGRFELRISVPIFTHT